MGLFSGFGKKNEIILTIDEVLPWLEDYFEALDEEGAAKVFLQEFENKKNLLFRHLNKLEEKLQAQHYSETIRTFFIQRVPP